MGRKRVIDLASSEDDDIEDAAVSSIGYIFWQTEEEPVDGSRSLVARHPRTAPPLFNGV